MTVSASTARPKAGATGAQPLTAEELRRMHAWWRACNYLAVGMIYLRDNPLLRERLKADHVKLRLLGHWGASPGLAPQCPSNRCLMCSACSGFRSSGLSRR